MVRHAQIIQKNKFSISLFSIYLKKEAIHEFDFLHADKDENCLQTDTMIFDGDNQAISKNSKFAMSLQYLEKEVRNEVDFLHANKHQNFLQVDLKTLSIKFFYKGILSLMMDMVKNSESAQSNKLAIALQYLKNYGPTTGFVFY